MADEGESKPSKRAASLPRGRIRLRFEDSESPSPRHDLPLRALLIGNPRGALQLTHEIPDLLRPVSWSQVETKSTSEGDLANIGAWLDATLEAARATRLQLSEVTGQVAGINQHIDGFLQSIADTESR